MTEWDVTITYDTPYPGEDVAAKLLGGLIESAGRSPWSDRLTIGVHLRRFTASNVSSLALDVADQALMVALGLPDREVMPSAVAVEVLHADEALRRGERPARDPLEDVIDADQAAAMLGVTPSAVRQRGEKLGGRQLGNGSWVFHEPTIAAHTH